METLITIAVICLIVGFILHRSADKSEKQFDNRPSVITNPAKDLYPNQIYAIVGLLASVQGASAITAFDEDVNKMVQSTIFSLGLSMSDVERYLKGSVGRNPDQEFDRVIASLKEIRDRNYLFGLRQKCMQIANMTGNPDTIEMVNIVFRELGF